MFRTSDIEIEVVERASLDVDFTSLLCYAVRLLRRPLSRGIELPPMLSGTIEV
jgi:hypothetical protein